MLSKLKNLFTKKPAAKKPRKPREKKVAPQLSEKEKATAAGEPYINVLSMEVDPDNLHEGSFELDFNDKFVLNLIRAGYKQKDSDTDNLIVERWFNHVCRNIALELYEQQQADPANRSTTDVRPPASVRDLGNGRKEIS